VAKRKIKKVVNPEMVKKSTYRVVLTLSGDPKEYIGEGLSMEEAMKNLERPTKFMAKAWIKATDGERKAELWMMPIALKRFMRPVFLHLQAVRLMRLLR